VQQPTASLRNCGRTAHYLDKISVKRCISKIAFLELNSWRCCLLHKKSYI